MRDALKETQSVIEKCMEILNRIPDGVEYDGLIDDVAGELCDLRDSHVKHALSASPRNCDVGTAEKQAERFHAFCKSNKKCGDVYSCERCQFNSVEDCELAWSQMPYDGGGAK